jgi:hypothetical protein
MFWTTAVSGGGCIFVVIELCGVGSIAGNLYLSAVQGILLLNVKSIVVYFNSVQSSWEFCKHFPWAEFVNERKQLWRCIWLTNFMEPSHWLSSEEGIIPIYYLSCFIVKMIAVFTST